MSELAETVNEAIEKGSTNRLHSIIAILVAITATFMALCNVKDGNVVQAMAQDQSKAVDAWAFYQAKSTKLNLAEAMLDQLTVQRALASGQEARTLLDGKITEYRAQTVRYEREKEEVKGTAQGYEQDFDRLNIRDDQLDMAEALMSISLALFGVTALTNKRFMLVVASVFAGTGGVLGIAAFAGLRMHPDFLARLLS
jgi:hypothetical protein